MTMKRKKVVDRQLPGRYGKMDAAQLDKEVQKFDGEFIADIARPLSPKERARESRAKRKRGRPMIGKGVKRVLVTIEQDLLQHCDAYARKKKLTRAAVVTRGLKALLGESR